MLCFSTLVYPQRLTLPPYIPVDGKQVDDLHPEYNDTGKSERIGALCLYASGLFKSRFRLWPITAWPIIYAAAFKGYFFCTPSLADTNVELYGSMLRGC